MSKYIIKNFKIGWIYISFYSLGKKFSIQFEITNNW